MTELLSISLLPVILTLLAYQLGLLCQKKLRSPIANPILIAVILVLVFLNVTGMELSAYQSGTSSISWLLTPATVCLAIPMYRQFQILRRNFTAIAAGIAGGTVACLGTILALAAVFGFDRTLTVSILPKSVTTAIGVPLSQMSGGVSSITTAVIILTGIFASILATPFCRLFRVTDPVAQGVAIGTSGHVIGTARANELSPVTGAASSLSLVIAGLLTAVLFPVLTNFIQ